MDEEQKKWSTKDFRWLIGILFGIISILILIIIAAISYNLSDDIQVINIISISAGLVSIILGILAILISFIQNNSSKSLYDRMNWTIERMDEKLNKVDSTVGNFNIDIKEITEALKSTFDNKFTNLQMDLNNIAIKLKDSNPEVSRELEVVSQKVSENIKETKEEIEKTTENQISSNLSKKLSSYTPEQLEILKKYISNPSLYNTNAIQVSMAALKAYINNQMNSKQNS